MIALTRSNVIGWLRSKHPDTVVGLRGAPCSCPLTNFLKETRVNAGTVSVGIESYRVDATRRPLPVWAVIAVRRIDLEGGGHGPVLAREALEILEGVP